MKSPFTGTPPCFILSTILLNKKVKLQVKLHRKEPFLGLFLFLPSTETQVIFVDLIASKT